MADRIKVHVLGHTDDPKGDGKPKIRMVTCPEGSITEATTDDQKLALAFQYGQNDFSEGKPEHNTTYSVSVGDVVELPDGDDPEADYMLYVVCMAGFQPITTDEFDELVGTPSRDRTFHSLCRGE